MKTVNTKQLDYINELLFTDNCNYGGTQRYGVELNGFISFDVMEKIVDYLRKENQDG